MYVGENSNREGSRMQYNEPLTVEGEIEGSETANQQQTNTETANQQQTNTETRRTDQ